MDKDRIVTYVNEGIDSMFHILNFDKRDRSIVMGKHKFHTQKSATLAALSKKHNITRERVRQIHNKNIASCKELLSKNNIKEIERLKKFVGTHLNRKGYVCALHTLQKDLELQWQEYNKFIFLLSLQKEFTIDEENKHKHSVLYHNTHKEFNSCLNSSLKEFEKKIQNDSTYKEKDFINVFNTCMNKKIRSQLEKENIFTHWVKNMKFVKKNDKNDWGHHHTPSVRLKILKDKLHYVFQYHPKSTLHFKDAAQEVIKKFNKKISIQVIHNDLMQHDDFVLIGRGIYGLKKHGYREGFVKDVIFDILNTSKKMEKNKLINKVLEVRHVRPNTVINCIYDKKYFTINSKGEVSRA